MSKTLAQIRLAIRSNLRETFYAVTERTGTVTLTATGATVSGSGTLFTSEYQVGDEIRANGVIRTILDIGSDTSLTVNKAFGVAAAGVAHGQVTRQGGWTDAEIDEAINDEKAQLQNRLWREAPRALWGAAVTADITAGVDMVTLPTGLLSVVQVQYRPTTATRYAPLCEVPVERKDAIAAWPWGLWPAGGSGVQKPTGQPTAFTVINPTTIELNVFPEADVTAGIRIYGPQRVSDLTTDSAVLAVPEDDGFTHALELMATAHLLLQEKTELDRYRLFSKEAEDVLRSSMAPWQAGGRSGPIGAVLEVE